MRQYYIVTETGEEVDYFEIEMLRHGCFGGGEIPADVLIFTGSLDPQKLIAQLTPAKDKLLVALIELESGSVSLQCTKDEQNLEDTKRYLGHKSFQRKRMSSFDILMTLRNK